MSNQCDSCIHRTVCAYRENYEDTKKTYEEVCGQYSFFKVEIKCVHYREDELTPKMISR